MTSRHGLLFACIAALLAIGAVVFASRQNYVFRFSEEELERKLNTRLPWTQTYLFVFDVTLDNPRIDLIEGADRIAGGVDVLLNVKLGANAVPLGGGVDVSGKVEYVSQSGEFYFTDPEITTLRVQGVPERYSNRANEAISLALEEYYKTRPFYTLERTNASKVAARLLLKDVTVKDEKLIVTLGLKKKSELED